METVVEGNQRPDFLDGLEFKAKEADLARTIRGPFAAIRVDGKGFSRFTKEQSYAVPYDLNFMAAMDAVARDLLLLVDGAHFAYAQSDEVSVIFSAPGAKDDPNWWFGGKLQKLVSLSAARATLSFARAEFERTGNYTMEPLFDARALELDGRRNAWEYLRWRRYDAQKNSVTMAAQTLLSSEELHGMSSYDRRAVLQGTELERLPEGFFNGRIHYRTHRVETVWNSREEKFISVLRKVPTSAPATREFLESAMTPLLHNRVYGQLRGLRQDGSVDTAERP